MMAYQRPLEIAFSGILAGVFLWLSGIDAWIQRWLWVNYHQGMNDVMRVLGELGKGTALIAICAVVGGILWTMNGKWRCKAPSFWLAVPVFALSGVVNWLVKYAVGRPRPKEWLMNGVDPMDIRPFFADAGWWSFPSGHSCSVFAVAVWLGLCFPRWRWPLIGVAVVLSASRFLAATPHYLGDVVAGAALGTAVAMAFKIWMDGRKEAECKEM